MTLCTLQMEPGPGFFSNRLCLAFCREQEKYGEEELEQRIAEAVAAAVAAPNDLTEEASTFEPPMALWQSVFLTRRLRPVTCQPYDVSDSLHMESCPQSVVQIDINVYNMLYPAASLQLVGALQLCIQVEKLQERIAGLEEELASAKKASTKVLDDASCQMEGMRALNQTVKKRCVICYTRSCQHPL